MLSEECQRYLWPVGRSHEGAVADAGEDGTHPLGERDSLCERKGLRASRVLRMVGLVAALSTGGGVRHSVTEERIERFDESWQTVQFRQDNCDTDS